MSYYVTIALDDAACHALPESVLNRLASVFNRRKAMKGRPPLDPKDMKLRGEVNLCRTGDVFLRLHDCGSRFDAERLSAAIEQVENADTRELVRASDVTLYMTEPYEGISPSQTSAELPGDVCKALIETNLEACAKMVGEWVQQARATLQRARIEEESRARRAAEEERNRRAQVPARLRELRDIGPRGMSSVAKVAELVESSGATDAEKAAISDLLLKVIEDAKDWRALREEALREVTRHGPPMLVMDPRMMPRW